MADATQGKKDNPLYRKTSADIGAKAATQTSVPSRYYGRKGVFTKEFGFAGNFQSNGLNTTMTKSKAMPNGSFGAPYYEP
jgi:hypothetical protein